MADGSFEDIIIRMPEETDGARMHALARQSPPLDLNSAYCYLLMSTHFSRTCTVAEQDGELVGFQTGYLKPEEPDALFIWQIAVGAAGRGKGLAKRMIANLLERFEPGRISYLEQTVTKSNRASRALFASAARSLQTELNESLLFGDRHFGSASHEAEYLLRIGPIDRGRRFNRKDKIQGVT